MSKIVKAAKLAGIAWLASVLSGQPALALIVLGTPEQPAGLVPCAADRCRAVWARAMTWLEQECLSTDISPEYSNSIFTYRNATGVLRDDHALKISISMRISVSGLQGSQIEIEQFDHGKYSAMGSDLPAQIFSDFRNYLEGGANGGR